MLHRHDIFNCVDICVVNRELVKSVAPEGPVMVTWANLHYLDFVLNWVDHVRACGIKSFLVGAMDDRILQVTQSTNDIRSILMGPRSIPSHDYEALVCSKSVPAFGSSRSV